MNFFIYTQKKRFKRAWKNIKQLKFLFYKNSPLNKKIIVFTMGRVGSKSIQDTLSQIGFKNVSKNIHYINHRSIKDRNIVFEKKLFHNNGYTLTQNLGAPAHLTEKKWRKTEFCYNILNSRGKNFIITSVREPIAQAISRFFFNLNYVDVDKYFAYHNVDINNIEDLKRCFLAEYDINVPLSWFDSHFNAATEVDIFSYEFDKKKGASIIDSHNKNKILLIKMEAENSTKEEYIEKFLGLDSFTLSKANTVEERTSDAIGNIYRRFIKNVKFDEDYLNNVYKSKLVKHFYTADEIDSFFLKWRS